MNPVTLTVIEMAISLIIEGVILTMIFNWISDKAIEKQQENLQNEMQNLEKQNKFDFEQLQTEIRAASAQCINEIKETHAEQIRGIERLHTQHSNSSGMTYTLKELPNWKDNSLMDQLAAYAEIQKTTKGANKNGN